MTEPKIDATLDDTLKSPVNEIDPSYWIVKIAAERHGLVPLNALRNPLAYYLVNTRNVGGYLVEWNNSHASKTQQGPRLSYSHPVRNVSGGKYGAWAVTEGGVVIHRDMTDTYTHWTSIELPTIALTIATDRTGHNAVVLCNDAILYVLRARGRVIQGPIALGVGLIADISISATQGHESSFSINVLSADAVVYSITGDQQVVVGRNLTELPADGSDDSLVVPHAVKGILSDVYRTIDSGLNVSLALGHYPSNSGPDVDETAPQAPRYTLVGASPYSTRLYATRDSPSPVTTGGPVMRSADDIRDSISELRQRINDDADAFEDATGDDYEPEWGYDAY